MGEIASFILMLTGVALLGMLILHAGMFNSTLSGIVGLITRGIEVATH